MELKYIYLGGFHKHFASDRTYSVWKFSETSWRIRDDLNQLVNMSDSAYLTFYRSKRLELLEL